MHTCTCVCMYICVYLGMNGFRYLPALICIFLRCTSCVLMLILLHVRDADTEIYGDNRCVDCKVFWRVAGVEPVFHATIFIDVILSKLH